MRATTFGRPGDASAISTEKPQSSRIAASRRATSPSPGAPGTRVGFLESTCINARASATASPRAITTPYRLLADLAVAFPFDFVADLPECFLAAVFIVVFFAAGFLAGACLAAGFDSFAATGATLTAATTGRGASNGFGASTAFGTVLVPGAGKGVGAFRLRPWEASTSRISLSASSCVIWPRRTMYWSRSRALSTTRPVRPAAAPTTSFIAAAILLPASRLISCAFAAISATVSFTSAPRWPGLLLGGTGGAPGTPGTAGTTAGAGTVATAVFSLSGIQGLRCPLPGWEAGRNCWLSRGKVFLTPVWNASGSNAAKYMIFRH